MRKKLLVIVAVVVAVFGIAAVAASPKLIELTSTPDFCNSCHVMNEQHEAWFMTGVHRTIKCIDCHLPHDNIVNHLVWKGIDGTKDLVYFHSGIYEEPIQLSDRGKRVLKANCIRCHEGVVSRIDTEAQECWSCHRRINHKAAIFN
ncbi:cytochrome c nitrite reductase small subunit [Desulfatitalea alkaliphila]|uniref:Cytochrome c nitrite reductase small subunit n=1 Tax=Desulfatitalea alkaliphila TaxID=2929485 RepID=A0AA41RDJ3_9BACT|nr:cytochrome c nitrite reductase small subunit [Desulfatitalea alkaliphila]MCJ8502853.1 cytochrome c nitrite reductase small subunit [Desulfatitalea alkaliphila]